MSVHAGQRAGRAIRDVPRTKNTAGTSRSMESSKPSGAQQPQLPAAGAQRRRQHLSWPRSMRRCHARQWLAAELQPAHEPRRRQSAAVRASAVKRGRLRGVAAATDGALSTNRDNLYFLMLSCSTPRRAGGGAGSPGASGLSALCAARARERDVLMRSSSLQIIVVLVVETRPLTVYIYTRGSSRLNPQND